jgi:plasmid stability protein
MPSQLLVRNLDDEVVEALRKRAAKHGRSVEEEHRRILKRALIPKKPKQSLLEALDCMPHFPEDDELFELPREVEARAVPFEDV